MLEHIIETYGYLALVVGTFFEGETILIIGGFAAHRGYLSLPLVIASGFLGSLAGDQLFFFIGRKKGKGYLEKKPLWKPKIEKVHSLLERHQTSLIVGFRFFYGFRTVTPFVIGTSRVKTVRFIILNIIGALLWAMAIAGGGYLFGAAFEALLGSVRHIEAEIMIFLACVGAVIWIIYFYRQQHRGG